MKKAERPNFKVARWMSIFKNIIENKFNYTRLDWYMTLSDKEYKQIVKNPWSIKPPKKKTVKEMMGPDWKVPAGGKQNNSDSVLGPVIPS